MKPLLDDSSTLIDSSSEGAGWPSVVDGGGGAGNEQLKGGTVPITPDQLAQIREVACAGPNALDAGSPPLTDTDGGACVYPMPQAMIGMIVDPQKVIVVLALTSSQSLLIAQSTSTCSQGDGWYFGADGNIVLCPQTCAMATVSSESVVQIYAGCETGCMCII